MDLDLLNEKLHPHAQELSLEQDRKVEQELELAQRRQPLVPPPKVR